VQELAASYLRRGGKLFGRLELRGGPQGVRLDEPLRDGEIGRRKYSER